MFHLARDAARRTLDFFGDSALKIDRKGDATPVTEADRSAERLIRNELANSFGTDAILGEEFQETFGTSGYRWIVDPIDGTKTFICGVPLYTTLLGLEFDSQLIGGAIIVPALDESLVAATGCGAWHRHSQAQSWQPARVSTCDRLENAVFVTSQVDTFAARTAGSCYESIQSAVSITRTWGDAYGYLLVATGRADIMIDPIVSPWDIAAVMPVIREAGGRFTDWSGGESIHGSNAIGTNGLLHDRVLEMVDRNEQALSEND